MSNPAAKSTPDRRAAILAAIEARTAGQPAPPSPSPSGLSSSTGKQTWTPPTPEEDRKRKLELGRIVARDIMGSNNYNSAATCIETLLKIAKNILSNPTDPKYAQIKTNNPAMRRTVLDLKGGQDYLVAMGFRSKTISFVQAFVIEPFPLTPKGKHGLTLGVDVLENHLSQALDRLDHSTASAALLASQESDESRRARALAEIDEDRERVKTRLEREKIGREAREKKAREQAEKEAREEEEREIEEAKAREEGGMVKEEEIAAEAGVGAEGADGGSVQ